MGMRKPCRIDGCLNPRYSGGLCTAHFWRNKRYGDPHGGPLRVPEDWLDWVVVWRMLHDHGKTDLPTLLGRYPSRAEYRAAAWVMHRDGHGPGTIAAYTHKDLNTVRQLLTEADLVDREELCAL